MSDLPVTAEEEESGLSRPHRRLLRRLYNGRITPIVAADRSFLTYREAVAHLLTLPVAAHADVVAEMKAHAATIGR